MAGPTTEQGRRHWLARQRRHPSALLLLVQLVSMALVPFIDASEAGRAAFSALGSVVLIATVFVVRRTPWLTWVSAGIAVPAIVLLAAQAWLRLPHLLPASHALEAVFYFYAAGSLVSYMLHDRHATTDELYCAGATFTLLAWGFTYSFLLLQALQPGCFAAAVNPQSARTWTELMYMSFALLSSTGIGDVIPITPHARALAALEMFVGVMYLAAVVSRLIGLSLMHANDKPQ